MYMDVPVLANQQELMYISSLRTQDLVVKTCRRRWTIGTDRGRESRKSKLAARLDDDDLNKALPSTNRYYVLIKRRNFNRPTSNTHSLTRSLFHSFTLFLPLSLTDRLNQSFFCSITLYLTHSLTHSLTYSFTQSVSHSLIQCSLAHSLTHSLTHSFTHLFIHPFFL